MLVIDSVALPEFSRVMIWAALLVPISCDEKSSGPWGDRKTKGAVVWLIRVTKASRFPWLEVWKEPAEVGKSVENVEPVT